MKIMIDLLLTEDGLLVLAVTFISLAVAFGIHSFIQKQIKESSSA
jgi:hypothetical protein